MGYTMSNDAPSAPRTRIVVTTVLIGALGYFVDIYDLLLFTIVRVTSLRDLGVTEAQSLETGLALLSTQMWGLLLGGVFWGILGDKRGRVSVLFGSILLYSLANIANAFVYSVGQYHLLRFVAGIGLAGELGAAITLVAETTPARSRGYGTAVVAGVGLFGAVAAALVARHFSWRTAYVIGGVLGLCLLVLRVSMLESGMFSRARDKDVRRGDIRMLFESWSRFARFARSVLIGLPIWFVIGILVGSSKEFASRAFHATGPVVPGTAILYAYIGLVAGDLGSGFLSQWMKSRRKVVGLFLALTGLTVARYLTLHAPTPEEVYVTCLLMGAGIGYWAVFVTIAAEQFGTNLRATVTTTVPNFVRGSVPLLTASFLGLRQRAGLDMVTSAAIVGTVCLLIAAGSLVAMEETYGKELDYTE